MYKPLLRGQAIIGAEAGSSLVELSLLVPVLALLLVGTIDFGRAYYMGIELTAAAEAGALYGVKNPTDTSGIQSAAQADAPSIASLGAAASYGCECPDGSGAVTSCSTTPSCSTNYVNYVDVTASATYNTLIKYPGIPNSLVLTSESKMRVGGD